MKLLLNIVALAGIAHGAADFGEPEVVEALGNIFVSALATNDAVDGSASTSNSHRDLKWMGGDGAKGGGFFGGGMDGFGFGNMTEMMEMLQNMNYTDIFDRCCPTNTTVMDGTTQYDLTVTESCNCPVRNNETFEAKWDESCSTSLGPKVMKGETFDMDKFMEKFSFMKKLNYTDVYDRCCSSSSDGSTSTTYDEDPSACSCPVRQNATFADKWESKCATFAMKASGDYYDEEKEGYGSAGGFDFSAMMANKNFTEVYMNCCRTQEGLPETLYDDDLGACSCPVRQKDAFAEKWTTECEEKYGPMAMAELEGGSDRGADVATTTKESMLENTPATAASTGASCYKGSALVLAAAGIACSVVAALF